MCDSHHLCGFLGEDWVGWNGKEVLFHVAYGQIVELPRDIVEARSINVFFLKSIYLKKWLLMVTKHKYIDAPPATGYIPMPYFL